MGLENNAIEIAITNLYSNAELYNKIAKAKQLQGEGYEKEYAVAVAQAEAFTTAAKMVEEALERETSDEP